MITQGIITIIISMVTPILALFPDITLGYGGLSPNEIYGGIGLFIRNIMYFLPMGTILFMFDLMILFLIVRCIIAFLKTLWAVIPIL